MKKSYFFLAISVVILILLGADGLIKDKLLLKESQQIATDFSIDSYSILSQEDSMSQKEYEKQQYEAEKEKQRIEDTINGLDLYAYYYDHLSPELQTVYGEIYYSVVNRESVTVSTKEKAEIDDAFSAVMYDHPEIFYVNGYSMTSHSVNDQLVSVSFIANYVYEADEVKELSAKAQAAAEEILSPVAKDWSDFNKIKYVFDYIIMHTEYETGVQDNQNILSVLLYGKSVCNGYSKTMQYLLNQLDVPCTLVTGDSERGKHAWNLIQADGHYYYLDATWGDVDYAESVGAESPDHVVLEIDYTYFLVDYDTIALEHTANDVAELPHCTSNVDNYYVHEDLYLPVMNKDQLQIMFNRAYAQQEEYVQFKCGNASVADEVYQFLIDEQGVFDYIKSDDTIAYYFNDKHQVFYFWFD